jgi:hypothetical protein
MLLVVLRLYGTHTFDHLSQLASALAFYFYPTVKADQSKYIPEHLWRLHNGSSLGYSWSNTHHICLHGSSILSKMHTYTTWFVAATSRLRVKIADAMPNHR